MGTSRSWAELDSKLTRLAHEYADLPNTIVPEAALVAKRAVMGLAPDRLRGVGKNGAKLSVAYNVSHGATTQALVFARGPWQLIEEDTRAHRIPRERASSRGRRRYAVIPGVGPRAYANHPGTKGKHPWRKGIEASRPVISRMFDFQAAVPLRRIF